MKRRDFVAAAACCIPLFHARSLRANAVEDCIPLRRSPPGSPAPKRLEIEKPGRYCMERNVTQWQGAGAGHVGSAGGFLLYIPCGNVVVDLNEYTLASRYGRGGVLLDAASNRGAFKRFPTLTPQSYLDNRYVSLRNGTIDVTGERTFGAVRFHDQWGDLRVRGSVIKPSALTARPPKFSGTYERNEYTLDRLKIFSRDAAVLLEGSHSVIRDCVIETNGPAAIFIAGPNATIENCEIRVRKSMQDYVKDGEPRAAIVLRDGSNAVIRNNTIRVDYGGEVDALVHCILIKDGASEVLIEGNTFVNVKGDPVTLEDNSQATVRNNKTVQRWL